ncbi:MAG TPA: hypothetical protein VEY30_11565 [Myxococcaceae bacterium]|nr:hypothetical protein [Myxococcaceae bacterium]
MKRSSLLAWVVVLGLPAAAGAQGFGARLGLETPVFTDFSRDGTSGSFWLGDSFQPTIDVIAEFYPVSLIGLGIEGNFGVAATGDYERTGTDIGPNVTFDFNPLPFYARAALPIHLEPEPVRVDFRAAGGVKLALVPSLLALYVEAAFDFPIEGGGRTDFFDTRQLNVGAGLWLKI